MEQCSQETQTSDMALRSPTAFHCIPHSLSFQPEAFLTAPRWGCALHSDQALRESSGTLSPEGRLIKNERSETLSQEESGRGNDDVYTVSNVCLFVFYLERKTQTTKDVYIYDCYNFNWYILLNVNILTESPNGTHYHKFTNMGSWGKVFCFMLACLSVR